MTEYEQEFASKLPVQIGGKEFIERYRGTTDNVTKIDPARIYAVKAPTEHAIYENLRVNNFSEFLMRLKSNDELSTLGELMFQSHASYAACGLTEIGTDRIVELVRSQSRQGPFWRTDYRRRQRRNRCDSVEARKPVRRYRKLPISTELKPAKNLTFFTVRRGMFCVRALAIEFGSTESTATG